ncbi:hypothetical protein CL622_05290 [archaeon]|nr:hypothetical protein [archaeon]|tara:strand:- start:110 stop:1126 length:1017 start_codon:yes stop_codon:yes gene_type:complete
MALWDFLFRRRKEHDELCERLAKLEIIIQHQYGQTDTANQKDLEKMDLILSEILTLTQCQPKIYEYMKKNHEQMQNLGSSIQEIQQPLERYRSKTEQLINTVNQMNILMQDIQTTINLSYANDVPTINPVIPFFIEKGLDAGRVQKEKVFSKPQEFPDITEGISLVVSSSYVNPGRDKEYSVRRDREEISDVEAWTKNLIFSQMKWQTRTQLARRGVKRFETNKAHEELEQIHLGTEMKKKVYLKLSSKGTSGVVDATLLEVNKGLGKFLQAVAYGIDFDYRSGEDDMFSRPAREALVQNYDLDGRVLGTTYNDFEEYKKAVKDYLVTSITLEQQASS